jgi:hypothetical protein
VSRKPATIFKNQTNQILAITETAGRNCLESDVSDEQFSNADSPRFEILEGAVNVNFESCPQPRKHDRAIVSTDEGMQID